MEMQEAYKEKMASQLKEWNAQIGLLEAKMENVGAEYRLKRSEELHSLRARHAAATEKMHELGKASGEAWSEMKTASDKMWDDLKAGVAEARAKFK